MKNAVRLSVALTALMAACTIEDRTPDRRQLATPGAPPLVSAADGSLNGTEADADTLLVNILSLDSTIIVDMRYQGPDNITGSPLPGYESNSALLHREAAEALVRVQKKLVEEGLSLKIFDAYRPIRATNALMEWAQSADREDLIANGYIAERSRHNLGVAVDCTIVDLATGEELEMGTAFDTFNDSSHTANAVGQVAVNRLRFVTAMAREGFVNYDREWWHFSHGVTAPLRFDVPVR